jgi:tetratricopeptide (TPR) repeat protein
MAAAYFELEDFDMALQFYEKDIKKRSRNISDRNIFKTELEKIEQTSYTHNQQSTLPILPKLFYSLVNEIQKIVALTDSQVSALADSFVRCGSIHIRSSSHLKAIKDYVAAFGLYASEPEKTKNEARKTLLIDTMTSLLKDFMHCRLKPKKIVDIYVQLSLQKEANQARLKLMAMHHDNELDDVDDDHSIDGSSHDPRAASVQHYKSLLAATNDADLKGVCYYNILRLYKHHLHPDQEGKDIINGLTQHLHKFHILDRRLLAEMSMDFLHEYDKGSSDQTLSQKWHLSAKGSLNTPTKDNEESFIGVFLFEIGNLSAAEAYWRSIIKQIESGLSRRVLDLVHDSDTTLKDILQATEHLERDNKLLCDHLATAYEKVADYCMQHATNGREVDRHSVLKANTMYKKAINLLERLDIDTDRTNNVKMKQKKAEEAATRKK